MAKAKKKIAEAEAPLEEVPPVEEAVEAVEAEAVPVVANVHARRGKCECGVKH